MRSNFKFIKVRRVDHTIIVTIDYPPVNATHPDVVDEIREVTEAVEEDFSVRSFILTATGRCFVGGGDIKFFLTLGQETAEKMALQVQKMQAALHYLRVPVIVAVNGHAMGGGLELMMACDIAIAEEHAMFGLTEVKLGLIPGAGGTRMLCRMIPRGTAKRMLFTGQRITAARAAELGLVDEVVPTGQSLEAAVALASEINACGPVAVAAAKKSAIYGLDHSLDEAHRREVELFGPLFRTSDHREGIAAFFERRPPEFEGR